MTKHGSASIQAKQTKKREMTVSINGPQAFEFMAAVSSAMPRDLNPVLAQRLIDAPRELRQRLRQALLDNEGMVVTFEPIDDDAVRAQLELWQKYYRDCHNIGLDLDCIRIPVRQAGFDHLIVVAQGLTPNRLVEAGRKSYDMWLYRDNLDQVIVHDDREPKEAYAIWVRDRQEADEELANQSAEDIWFKKLTGETLLERLIHGDEEFNRTGRHLDENNVTLCSGSRGSDGRVPGVDWNRDRRGVCVYWCNPGGRRAGLRCRLAVAL